MLRQAMLLNGILYNSEAWHSLTEKDIKVLEAVDQHLLRSLVKGHSKVPLEFLFLETGAIPLRFMISSRRLNYLQTILKREDDELTKRIYRAQANDPSPGDFIELVKNDFCMIDVEFNERKIAAMTKESYKNFVKRKIRIAAFEYLKNLQKTHSKIRNLVYNNLEIQNYMTSPLFSDEEVNILHALRSRAIDCKDNYKNMYKQDDLLCSLCRMQNCDQKHILECKVLLDIFKTEEMSNHNIVYEDIFHEDVSKQKAVTALFKALIELRSKMLQDLQSQQSPSTSTVVLRRSDILPCIMNSSFGK